MTERRIAVQPGTMQVRAYPVLAEAVERGVAYGWWRAHKHTDSPGEAAVGEAITRWFDFPEAADG